MKRLNWILLGALLLAGCAPASTPTPTLAPTVESSPTSVPVPPTPTLIPVPLAGPQAGTSMNWIDGGQLVYVPLGDFIMGLGIGDAPQKTVSLDGYWIDSTKVTNKMYAQCVASGNCTAPTVEIGSPVYTNPDYGDYPVTGVTWDMASTYCQWAGGNLPSEAQWEKAARGADGAVYPWGNDLPGCDVVNSGGCLGHTSGVLDFPEGKSPFGAYDMAGNTFEWVNDYYAADYYNDAPPLNPTGPASGDSRVVRGSSFESEDNQILSGLRHPAGGAYHSRDLGFRCVVQQPKVLAPFCQTASYIPSGAAQTSTCQTPDALVRGNYCSGGNGYTTIDISQGAAFQVSDKRFKCTEAVLDGQRRVTCQGPNLTSADLSVCNPTCSTSPDVTGAAPVCDPGYSRDASTGACVYTPILGQPGAAGCPVGYLMLDRGGGKTCVLSVNQNGQCPTGMYLDSLYGTCVAPSGDAYAPYGIDNPALAATAYQGCAAGYNFDPTYQCCQAAQGGAYPGCPLGTTYHADEKTCIPNQVRLSGPGCVSVALNIAKCSEPKDICSRVVQQQLCLRMRPVCQWDDKNNICSMVKQKP